MKYFSSLISSTLLTAFALLVMTGCNSESAHTSSQVTISVALEVDEPVEDGLSVQTARLGKIHLGKPLLSATYKNNAHIHLFDITLTESLLPEPFLFIPARLFLNQADVLGMESTEILEKLSSAELSPGQKIYLIADSSKNRIVHQLTTTWQSDYSVFVQSELGKNDWDSPGFEGLTVEVRKILNENDPAVTEVKITAGNSNEVYWVSPPMFMVTQHNRISGIPWRSMPSSGLKPASTARGQQDDRSELMVSKEALQDLNGKHVVLTTTDSAGRPLATKALFWSSLPGLHLKLDTPTRLEEIKRDSRSLGYRYNIDWHSATFSERGSASSGGTL